MLQEVKSGPLPHQDPLSRPLNPDGDASRRETIAILHQLVEADRGIHLAKDLPSQCGPTEDTVLTRDHLCQATLPRVDNRGPGEVVAVPVFGQGPSCLGLYLSPVELAQPA